MASLRRHPKSSNYIACFTGESGKRYQRSTGIRVDGTVATRRKAQKIADEFEDVARRKNTARQIQKVFHDIYKEVTGEALPDQSVRRYAEDWLKDRKGAIAPKSHDFYGSRVNSFLLSLGVRAEAPVFQITASDVREWRDGEAQRVSTSTTNHGLKVIRMLLGDAKKQNLSSENPAESVPVLKKDTRSTRRPFSISELDLLLNGADGEWRSLIVFGLYTGQRLGDLARMPWSEVDLDSFEIRFTTRKTGRHQKIPICAPLLSHIKSLPTPATPSSPIHPDAFDLVARQGKPSTLSRQFHDLMSKVGLVVKRPHRKGGNAPENRIYTHLEEQTLKSAMDLLPDVVG
jgi:integrase